MKKLFLVGLFALLTFVSMNSALAQTDAAAAGITAKNHTTAATNAAPAEDSSLPKAAVEAQKNYETGLGLYNSGKLAEAIDAFKESNKLKPNDPQTQYMLGMAYWKNKAYVQAVDSFKRAVKTKPEWDEPYFRLGLSYYVLGRTSQTNETYKRLLELNPTLAAKLARIVGEPSAPVASETAKAAPKPAAVKPALMVPVSSRIASTKTEPSAPIGDASKAPTKATAAKMEPPAVSANDKPAATAADATVSNSASAPTVSLEAMTTTAAAVPAKAVVAEDLPLTDIYRVGAGDVLDIRLLNSAANHSTLYSVIDGGLLDFPIAGAPIPVAGLTTQEIQARITSALKRLAVAEQTQVAVGVRQYGSHTVIVTGLAGSPGTKTLRREAVPLYVLLAEIQPRLDAARVTIMRASAAPQTLDINDSTALNFIVRPGDVINLTARQQDFYYIAGDTIGYPGQKLFQPGITLVQAILGAGGQARDGAVQLSREGADGRLATMKLNLKEIKSGKIQDPKLQPGDRVEVLH
jgi:protein involved in polysaccharide export with SLBB domain/Flp pilus assembly protein TadD